MWCSNLCVGDRSFGWCDDDGGDDDEDRAAFDVRDCRDGDVDDDGDEDVSVLHNRESRRRWSRHICVRVS